VINIKRKKTKTYPGYIVYKGKSILNPKENIVVINTYTSKNEKTGNMVQQWIFVDGEDNPLLISQKGNDNSICGNCPHRHSANNTCYVDLSKAPRSIWDSYKKGNYPIFDAALHGKHFAHRKIRFGAYGDPAAVPYEIQDQLSKLCLSWTGYTHQAAHKNFDSRIANICMVSVDTPRQAMKYQDRGYRTFRVALENDNTLDSEIQCLNTTEEQLQCIDCGLCDGLNRSSSSIAVPVHGPRKSSFKSSLIPTLEVA